MTTFQEFFALVSQFFQLLFSGDWEGLAGFNWNYIDEII